MTTGRHSQVFQQLRQAVLARDGAGLTDAELMAHFVGRRDGAALEALIRRHGSMVWSVCRRVLSNEQDAEDAFQASFLVFVRKAASIRARQQVGNWLYGVAYRTALKVRTTDVRRRAKERRAAEVLQPQAEVDAGWSELLPLLDQELNRLPDKYRAAIVLCELEGRPRKEAARQLGIPEGTLSSRLATGRRMLAKRLGRPGLGLSAGALATTSAVVPPTLMASTVKAVTLVAAGQATIAGVVSVRVAALAEGVVKAMLLTKLSVGAAVLAVVVVLAAGAGGAAYYAAAADPKPAPKALPVAAVQPKERNVDKEEVKKEEPEWGEAVDGVQARLRPAKVRWHQGETTEFILDMRNRGEHYHKAHREPWYCEIELDGQWYLPSSPEDFSKRVSRWLEAGKQIDDWVHVSLTDGLWVRKTPGRKRGDRGGVNEMYFRVGAGKHTLRIAFVFEDGIRPVSQAAEFEIGAESAWGEAVDGVQARIRTLKAVWIAGEEPTFSLDLRNQGKKTPDQRRVPVDCQIEVDKVWYSYEIPSGPYVVVGYPLKPGEQINDWTTVTPDENWVSLTAEKKRFPLSPGKHSVRIALWLQHQDGAPNIRPVSGPIEIEVEKEPAPGKPVAGVQPPTKQAAPSAVTDIDIDKQTPARRAVDIQKKLSETINYELTVDTTLDKALDELLTTARGIPWTVNDAAFGPDNKDIVKTTAVGKIDPIKGVTVATVLKRLLAKIPNDTGKTSPTYLIRPDSVEITTRDSFQRESYPNQKISDLPLDYLHLPPLAYAVFEKVPLSEALAELGRTTGGNVIVAGYAAKEAETKVTAELNGVPLDAAVTVLADMADLKCVRVGNVYYVTTPERARVLEAEEKERLPKDEIEAPVPAKPQADKVESKK
jgi:RNA polymerase sigma factor (sigma-70 family)